ncbi:MAG TPA: cytochrome c biogenesis protein CcdA [Syntrophales bacterium]|nr:cytochrome c biogenesis protein CcdA [Syntrophales bacterium]HPQ44999.1 cytochrome c biogenesis protein CcdA [Syntrophales bacterium]
MDWIVSIAEWAKTTLEQAGTSPLALPLAFVLGLASSVASACCTLPVFGAIIGYAGMRDAADRRSTILGASFFMVGTTIALLILGSVAGLIGQVAQSVLGQYWKIFAGIIAIVVGLGALNLLPFNITGKSHTVSSTPKRGLLGAVVVGLIMGGAVSVCSLGCNPGIFIILGVAVLQGYTLWMFGVLITYAIGFSLPLAALMLGVSFGKSAIRFQKADNVIRFIAGVVLIGVGFYFFYSL